MKQAIVPSVFDLDQAMAAWRSRLLERQNCDASDAVELGGHLLDEIERLRALGLSTEEAFWVACKRLGDPIALSAEFAKIDPLRPWRTQLIWMATGFVGIKLLGSLLNLATSAIAKFAVYFGLGGPTVAVVNLLTDCVVPLVIVLLFVQSATSPRGRRADGRSALRSRMPQLAAAAPVYYLILILAVYLPLYLADVVGGYRLSFRPDEAYGTRMSFVMYTEVAWSLFFPILVALLVLRGRRATARSASAE
jgi:hypothetical protein